MHIFSFQIIKLISIFAYLFICIPYIAFAAEHIVISEIQIAGETANDEFIELYNPTQESIVIEGWRVSKKTASETSSPYSLVSKLSGTIAPKHFFLIAHPSYTGTVVPDVFYSATSSGIAANNTIILYSDNGQTVVDKVGMGTAQDKEQTTAAVPEEKKSIERKAFSSSTIETLQTDGTDEYEGNAEDSNDNQNDFILRQVPQPQNSHSDSEPRREAIDTLFPTPTRTPTPTNTPTPTTSIPALTNTPTPTTKPSLTPAPTVTPSPLPTPTSTPTPTETVAPLQALRISPKPVRSPSPSPTNILPISQMRSELESTTTFSSKDNHHTSFLYKKFTCFLSQVSFKTPFGIFALPYIYCRII